MDEQFTLALSEKMLKGLDIFRQDLTTVRTGRATPQLVENVTIAAYGGSQKLRIQELATIAVYDARTITISPYDPSITEEIVKGIQEANLGFNPQSEGKIIRIIIPPLTQERRQEFLKLARSKAEGGRIMIRGVRHDAMSSLKRQLENGEIDQDSKKRLEKRIQELTDEMIAQVNSLLEKKEEDLMKL